MNLTIKNMSNIKRDILKELMLKKYLIENIDKITEKLIVPSRDLIFYNLKNNRRLSKVKVLLLDDFIKVERKFKISNIKEALFEYLSTKGYIFNDKILDEILLFIVICFKVPFLNLEPSKYYYWDAIINSFLKNVLKKYNIGLENLTYILKKEGDFLVLDAGISINLFFSSFISVNKDYLKEKLKNFFESLMFNYRKSFEFFKKVFFLQTKNKINEFYEKGVEEMWELFINKLEKSEKARMNVIRYIKGEKCFNLKENGINFLLEIDERVRKFLGMIISKKFWKEKVLKNEKVKFKIDSVIGEYTERHNFLGE